jgi:hypothetical protein
MHTFAVTDVPLCKAPLAPTTLPAALTKLEASVEAAGCNLTNLIEMELHGFLGAVHHAFDSHYPLVLSPDDVWLCIAQGFAIHVDLNAEALRGRFVRHQGKELITVIRDEFVRHSPDNDWPGCFAEFSDQIAVHLGKKRDLVVADFSTTGPVEKAASEIVLMAAMRRYFDYKVVTRCGIPSITLLGSVDDWKSIRHRAEVLAEFDLEWWVRALVPVLDQFVAAASGRPDQAFWQSFYKWDDRSGGPYISGWINVLFPYVVTVVWTRARAAKPTPSLMRNEFAAKWAEGLGQFHSGPNNGEFTNGLSKAPFVWDYLGTKIPMEFIGGFVGVSQDPETFAVRPAIGWAVKEAPAA